MKGFIRDLHTDLLTALVTESAISWLKINTIYTWSTIWPDERTLLHLPVSFLVHRVQTLFKSLSSLLQRKPVSVVAGRDRYEPGHQQRISGHALDWHLNIKSARKSTFDPSVIQHFLIYKKPWNRLS